jgi:Icc-related predicted phosphoesterase
MKVLVFSDIHGDLRTLRKLLATEADYYFSAGDLVTWARGFERAGPILKERAGRVYVIPGNHESEADIARLCDEYGLTNFHGQNATLGGHVIAGLGYSNKTPFHTPGEYTEEQMAEQLARFDALSPSIVVAHCPPYDTKLDEAGSRQHIGSTSVRYFIERVQPAHFLCGHVHEAAGRSEQLGRTHAINVGKQGYMLKL